MVYVYELRRNACIELCLIPDKDNGLNMSQQLKTRVLLSLVGGWVSDTTDAALLTLHVVMDPDTMVRISAYKGKLQYIKILMSNFMEAIT